MCVCVYDVGLWDFLCFFFHSKLLIHILCRLVSVELYKHISYNNMHLIIYLTLSLTQLCWYYEPKYINLHMVSYVTHVVVQVYYMLLRNMIELKFTKYKIHKSLLRVSFGIQSLMSGVRRNLKTSTILFFLFFSAFSAIFGIFFSLFSFSAHMRFKISLRGRSKINFHFFSTRL